MPLVVGEAGAFAPPLFDACNAACFSFSSFSNDFNSFKISRSLSFSGSASATSFTALVEEVEVNSPVIDSLFDAGLVRFSASSWGVVFVVVFPKTPEVPTGEVAGVPEALRFDFLAGRGGGAPFSTGGGAGCDCGTRRNDNRVADDIVFYQV